MRRCITLIVNYLLESITSSARLGKAALMSSLMVCLIGFNAYEAKSQILCDSLTPFFDVDLTGEPDSIWVSPSVTRDGLCCDAEWPDRCIEFQITLDENSVGMEFSIISGAVPSGALFYQISCLDSAIVGDVICLPGGETYNITFCEPGNNPNEYEIAAVPGVILPDSIVVRADCSGVLEVSGIESTSTTWNDITGGGIYNAYLSCLTGCLTNTFTPDSLAPPLILYEVCGETNSSACDSLGTICDTVEAYVIQEVIATISPYPPVFCEDAIEDITLSIVPIYLEYEIAWYDGYDGTGTIFNDSTLYTPTQNGSYSIIVIDTLSGLDCNRDTLNFDIVIHPLPIFDLGPDLLLCIDDPYLFDLPDSVNYTWSPMTGVSYGSDSSIFIVTAPVNTFYTVVAEANGCIYQDSIQIDVQDCTPFCPELTLCVNAPTFIMTTVSEFLSYGGSLNYPCAINEMNIDMINETSDMSFCPETITQTYELWDDCGNTDYCDVTFTLMDTLSPTISCPPILDGVCSLNEFPPYSNLDAFLAAGGTVNDKCAIDTSSFALVSTDSSGTCAEIFTRRYAIYDLCGNMATCVQTINIDDDIAPTITCPDTTFVSCTPSSVLAFTNVAEFVTGGGMITDNCSIDSVTFSLDLETQTGSCPQLISRQYSVEDLCGNISTCVHTVMVFDTVAPIADTLADIGPLACFLDIPAPNVNDVTGASDNCSGQVKVSFDSDSADPGCNGVVIRKYIIADNCNNVDTLFQSIVIQNDPVQFLESPADITISCDSAITLSPFDIPYSNNSTLNCLLYGSVKGNLNGTYDACGGSYIQTWSFTDSCGNNIFETQTITVDPAPAPGWDSTPANETIT